MLFILFESVGKLQVVMFRILQDFVSELTYPLQIYKNKLINVKNTLNNSGLDFSLEYKTDEDL